MNLECSNLGILIHYLEVTDENNWINRWHELAVFH